MRAAKKSRRSALAEAEAIEGAKRGEAEKARRVAEADAEAMDKKAAAFAGYNEAAVLQMLIEVMPKVAAELARPTGDTSTS